jgi:ABC-type sugar transport system ATPase subunit
VSILHGRDPLTSPVESRAVAAAEPPGSAAPLLEARQLVKDYPGTRALDHMDFDVRAGEVHALLGENGAGKSTLIKALAGVVRFDSGEILLDGQPVAPRDPHEGRELGIGVVHQQGNLVPTLSVAENLLLGEPFPKLGGVLVDRRAMRRRVESVLRDVGLRLGPNALVADISPHEAGMVAVAKALLQDARIVVLDEPTTALSASEVQTLFEKVRELARRGIAFVYISHRLGEIFQIADRATVMRDGRKIGTWPISELDHRRLVDAIAGEERALKVSAEALESAARDEVVLEIEGLRAPALHGVDVRLRAGEVLGVAGLPGMGAEELLNVLFGNLPRHGGVIRLDGREVAPRSPVEARDAGFAFVPKDRHAQALVPGFGVRENITIASTERYRADPITRWMNRGAERAEARSVIARLSIKTSGNQEIGGLSGGNQQKAVIGRWLSRGARVYLFDDPSAGVDVHSKAEIYAMIRELAREGAGVVFTSTELEEIPRVCDRVLVFRDGRVSGELVGAEIDPPSILRFALTPVAGKEAIDGSS